jgi:hypothetical protein
MAFVTGTMAFGPLSKESDIDIVMLGVESKLLATNLVNMGVQVEFAGEVNPEYKGFKFTIEPLPTINIVVAIDDKDAEAWAFATEAMRRFGPVENKQDRIAIFQTFKNRYYEDHPDEFPDDIDAFQDI